MASSDDFKKQLKAGNIKEALALALTKAMELNVTTWVASGSDALEPSQIKPGHRLCTQINAIEGKIENEIGDQFIGNGPYKELRQFHLEQVTQGNKIIQNNLKSLQKLFEVFVAMRYQGAIPPVIDPDSLDNESPLLPPTEEVPDGGVVVDDSVVNPDTLDSDIDEEDDWDDSVLDLLESLPVVPPPNRQALTSQLDEDWRDFMEAEPAPDSTGEIAFVDQDWEPLRREDFESPPTAFELNSEASQAQFNEDWQDFIGAEPERLPTATDLLLTQQGGTFNRDVSESLPTSVELNTEAPHAQRNDNQGGLVREQPEPLPTATDLLLTQHGETLTPSASELAPTSPEPSTQASSPQDEDWGWEDLGEEQIEPESAGNQPGATLTPDDSALPTSSVQDIEAPDHQEWGNAIAQDPEPQAVVSQPGETLTSEDTVSPDQAIEAPHSEIEDEDWGDLVSEEPTVGQNPSIPSLDSLALEEDEEWDDWVVEETEPLQGAPALDIELLDLGEDEDWGDFADESNPFIEASVPSQSGSNLEVDKNWDDFTAEEPEPHSTVPNRETIDTSIGKQGSFEELEGSSNHSQTTNPPQEEPERGNLSKDSESLVKSEDDLDAQSKPAEKRVPPPPPPSRFPNQNN